MDGVIHAASYVGRGATTCEAVNTAGTDALVHAARAEGVGKIVQIGTAAVHGRGPHRNATPASTPTRPESVVSVTRLAGEQQVRAAGGIVVRPHLVYGAGDRWVIPALARLIIGAGMSVGDPVAVHSLVHVADLARVVVGLIDVPDQACTRGTVLAANHPVPVTTAALVAAVVDQLRLPVSPDMPLVADGHDLSMLGSDHWFASTKVWEVTGIDPGAAFPQGLERCAAWYRTTFGDRFQYAAQVDDRLDPLCGRHGDGS